MKKIIYLLAVVLLASCSGPKYTASFNSYDSPRGYHKETIVEAPVVVIDPATLVASTSEAPIEIKETEAPVTEVRKTYIQMTKTERKALRNHIRTEIKSTVKEQKAKLAPSSTAATSAMDNDLKLAIIFGAVGIVGLMLGGASNVFFYIGGIALLVGVVFFVKWVIRQ
ncbi:MAG: hypothetical protein IPK96_07640 [Flammeovirgaceae bacterium]|jgi:hypothetical protein|nr:hypothetical protein [Flammeovirgaceae bacterium]